jgi:histidine ammonia-lyase
MIAAAQAFDFRAPTTPSPACQAAYEVIRKHVAKLEEDRPLYSDINGLTQVARSGEILAAVEKIVGPLK